MARYGAIPSNLAVTAGQAVRRKLDDSGFEGFTPSSGTAASNTEVLTGTDTAKFLTPDSFAAFWETGTDVASATTISLGEGGYFNITGTTNISDIDFATDKSGRPAKLKFAGILTLVHSSTLILPNGGSNIITAAGDTAEFVSEGGDIVRCIKYQRASGSALVDSSGTEATTTEALTGTATGKYISPSILSAIWKQGSDIASASTISIGDGGVFNITGTTTITDIDFATDTVGRTVWLRFSSSLVLTHSSTLIMPGGYNVVAAAGDIACFKSNGSDIVECVHFQRALNFPNTQKEVYLEKYGFTNSGLAAAISAIGSTVTDLYVDQNLTVSTTQTTPITCRFIPRNGAIITISGSATLTINNFFDPGNIQCFAGVSASNHVILNNVPRHNLAWYMGTTSSSDATYAVTDICTAITNAGGGVLFAPVGSWKVNNITCPSYSFQIFGQGMGSDTGGTRWIPTSSGTTYLFQARNDFRNISASHCAFSVTTNTATNAFNIDVDTGSSGFGIDFDHCTFHGSGSSSLPLLNSITDNGAAEFVRGSVVNCQFIIPNNSKGIYIDSINTQMPVKQCSFVIGTGSSIGIDYYRNLYPSVKDCDFRGAGGAYSESSAGTGTFTVSSGSTTISGTFNTSMLGQHITGTGISAGTYIKQVYSAGSAKLSAAASANNTGTYTYYKYQTNSARGGTCIQVGDIGAAFIQGCQEEGFNYFLNVIGVGLDRPTTLIANKIQDRIKLEGTATLNLIANHRPSNCLVDTAGSGSEIFSTDYVAAYIPEDLSVTLDISNDWSQLRAGSSYFKQNTGPRVGLFQQDFPYFTRILEESGAALTRPLLDIGTTYGSSGSSQMLLRLGLFDSVAKTFLYGHTFQRDNDTGYLKLIGSQSNPYNGFSVSGPFGYDATNRATPVTQGTSRNTTVTANGLHGVITCYASTALPAGGSAIFQVNNTWVQNSDFVHVQIADGATSELTQAWCSRVGGNFFKITIFNHSLTTSDTGVLKVQFFITKNGGLGGNSY